MSTEGFDEEASDIVLEESSGDEEKLEQLIEEVKKRKILYDPQSVSNRNTFLKERAWKEIGLELEMSDVWCKSEWTKLRNNYAKKKKAIVGKTGQRRKKIESWTHFFALKFLDDYSVKSRTSGNITQSTKDTDVDQSEVNEQPVHDSTEPESSETTTTPTQGTSKADTVRVPVEKRVATPCTTYSAKRHQKTEADRVDSEMVAYLSEKRQKLDKAEPDDHHHFGLSVAARLRKMKDETASFVKMQIMQLLHESEYPPASHTVYDLPTD